MNALRTVMICATALTALIPLQGCTSKSSSSGGLGGGPVPTRQMHLDIRVEAKDAGTAVVSGRLSDGRALGTQYRLDGGDYLRACVGPQCRNLRDDFDISDILFPFFPDGYSNGLGYYADTDYVVSFYRPDAEDASDSRVTLPQPFDIVYPAANQEVTDGDSVWVEWLPVGTGERIDVDTHTECEHIDGLKSTDRSSIGYDGDGDGRELLDVDAAVNDALEHPTSFTRVHSCRITVQVSHERRGVIDPAFDGGEIVGVVSRKVRLTYYPSR